MPPLHPIRRIPLVKGRKKGIRRKAKKSKALNSQRKPIKKPSDDANVGDEASAPGRLERQGEEVLEKSP